MVNRQIRSLKYETRDVELWELVAARASVAIVKRLRRERVGGIEGSVYRRVGMQRCIRV